MPIYVDTAVANHTLHYNGLAIPIQHIGITRNRFLYSERTLFLISVVAGMEQLKERS